MAAVEDKMKINQFFNTLKKNKRNIPTRYIGYQYVCNNKGYKLIKITFKDKKYDFVGQKYNLFAI